jgi:ABC-2 type transport system permease protein
VLFEVLMPVLTVCAYVWVYRAIDAPEEYVGYVVLGGAMMAFWANVMWSMSSQLYWEKEQGNLGLYLMSPASLMAILLGMAVGGLLGTAVRAAAILGLGIWFFKVPFALHNLPALILVFFLAMTALYGLGMMLASLFLLLNREAYHLVHLTEEPIYLLSGFFFPITSFPFWISTAAAVVPLTLGLDAIRQLAFPAPAPAGFLSVGVETVLLLVLSIVYLYAARLLLQHMEKLAIRDGRLTESRR